jgi:hypothetical protein
VTDGALAVKLKRMDAILDFAERGSFLGRDIRNVRFRPEADTPVIASLSQR